MAMTSVKTDFVTIGAGQSRFNPTITVHGRIYHAIGALRPPSGGTPRFESVYIHDTDEAASNRKYFYGKILADLLRRLSTMLEQSNNLVKSFISLRQLIESKNIPEDVKLVIHAHERNLPGHARKYNLPEASEVAALIVSEKYGKLDIVLRHRGKIDKDGNEKLDFIHIDYRMYDLLAYPLLFPYGSNRWHSMLRYVDSKGRLQKVPLMKFYTIPLYQRTCDFNTLTRCGRLFQQFLSEMFVKSESERLSFLRKINLNCEGATKSTSSSFSLMPL